MTNRAELNSSAARKKGGSVGCRLSFLVGHPINNLKQVLSKGTGRNSPQSPFLLNFVVDPCF